MTTNTEYKMPNMFVHYKHNLENFEMTETLSWEAFCNLSMEYGVDILFCCTEDDPRINVE